MRPKAHILPLIVFAQFCGTSLWFAGNAVVGDLAASFSLEASAMGHLTSAVQFGFIMGSMSFALGGIADRYAPNRVFFISALLGSIFNLTIVFGTHSLTSLLALRFLTGFFLAGIYPVGMKIAADYYNKGLGKSLGYLVGALVLGTAFPHLLMSIGSELPWRSVMLGTSVLASSGALLLLIYVPDGPYRTKAASISLRSFWPVFRQSAFRSAAFGYFGHMWELYALWAFVPVLLSSYAALHPSVELNISLLSFMVIGIGSLGCIAGGYLSMTHGTRRIALSALSLSGLCCLLSPLMLLWAPPLLFIAFLVFWGLVVIADSPLFSTLVAQHAFAESKGTALTMVNCIGFAITILSIELLSHLEGTINPIYLCLPLAAGPALGIWLQSKKSLVTEQA